MWKNLKLFVENSKQNNVKKLNIKIKTRNFKYRIKYKERRIIYRGKHN